MDSKILLWRKEETLETIEKVLLLTLLRGYRHLMSEDHHTLYHRVNEFGEKNQIL